MIFIFHNICARIDSLTHFYMWVLIKIPFFDFVMLNLLFYWINKEMGIHYSYLKMDNIVCKNWFLRHLCMWVLIKIPFFDLIMLSLVFSWLSKQMGIHIWKWKRRMVVSCLFQPCDFLLFLGFLDLIIFRSNCSL